ncbi:hypothetical protein BDY21DRAFT_333670 [Lineolata rhizophorae]|uniref:Large ribosomal subunit protein uL23m n=1 Tax=Lineolata rhizophorae TaxID=578093 RepID=A0A6A6PAM8_9PEZI|nr:hypothetical protein BDY21DRAFT_333670 [Lineolata rhizophorae]
MKPSLSLLTNNINAKPIVAPHFRFGRKPIYLPNFDVTLLRTKHLPVTQAKFQVPLFFSKLDLRDYLYNCYGVRAINIRSYVKYRRVQLGRSDRSSRHERATWIRPRPHKFMFIDMDRPFVWPDEPTDFEPWDKEQFELTNEYQQKTAGRRNSEQEPRGSDEERKTLAEQARDLLEGRQKWKPTDSAPAQASRKTEARRQRRV